MKTKRTASVGVLGALLFCIASCNDDDKNDSVSGYAAADLQRGAQLYDQWWSVPGAKTSTAPVDTNPGYSLTTGTQTGAVTWRCKECHGWDYRGALGAYATGSHATGAPGLLGESSEPAEDLFDAIKNGVPSTGMTAFGTHLSDKDIWDLVKFVKEGLVDTTNLFDPSTRAPLGADPAHGEALFGGTCALSSCHGREGNALNFGSTTEPEFVGTIANDNPWEFLHKVRAGQPGTAMPSALKDTGWTVDDILDAMSHARTLPTE